MRISKTIKEMGSLVLQASPRARKRKNAHFRALDGNHYPLQQCRPHITMTTTKRLPSSKAKTIEILIKATLFFFFWRMEEKQQNISQKCMIRHTFRIQKYFCCFPESRDLSLPPQSPPSCPLNNSNFIDLINLDLSRSFIKQYKTR